MNCQECEKNSWIYAELSEAERSQLGNHIQTCSDCRRRYQEMVVVSQILKQATPIVPELKNAAALTSRIMDELPPKNQSWRALFLSSFDNTWVQNSLRLASMVLVILFVWESNPDSNQLTKHFPGGKTVVLNSIAFVRKYDELRGAPKRVTFYQRYQKAKKSHI
jgi:hypothetical protein